MSKLTSSNNKERLHRQKTLKKNNPEQNKWANPDISQNNYNTSGKYPIKHINSLSLKESDKDSIAGLRISPPVHAKLRNQIIASTGRTSGIELIRQNHLPLVILETPGNPVTDTIESNEVSTVSPHPDDKRNLPALLSFIFGGSGLLFFIATLVVIYTTIVLILLVGAYLLAAAAIVLGAIGIWRAIKLKKRHLGFAIAGAGIGFLLLIALILAAAL